jgi:hypothetical protein
MALSHDPLSNLVRALGEDEFDRLFEVFGARIMKAPDDDDRTVLYALAHDVNRRIAKNSPRLFPVCDFCKGCGSPVPNGRGICDACYRAEVAS